MKKQTATRERRLEIVMRCKPPVEPVVLTFILGIDKLFYIV